MEMVWNLFALLLVGFAVFMVLSTVIRLEPTTSPDGASEGPPEVTLTGARAAGRCPYCHAPAALEEAVACAECAARHHTACWDEYGECSACGARGRFGSLERSPGHERPDRSGGLKA